MLIPFAIFGLVLKSCTPYNPSLYPSYDVLNPGTEVKKNPIGFIYWDKELQSYIIEWDSEPQKDQVYVIINTAMVQWIGELKEEIKKERER